MFSCLALDPEHHTQYPALEIFLDTKRRITNIVGSMMKAIFDDLILSPWSAYKLNPGSPIGGASVAMLWVRVVHSKDGGAGLLGRHDLCDQSAVMSLLS